MVSRPGTQSSAEGEGQETRPRFTTTTDAYADDIYRDAFEDDAIHEFLEDTDDFNSSRRKWTTPELPTSTENLLGAVTRVFSAIVERFAGPTVPGVERKVVSSGEMRTIDQGDDVELRNPPTLLVRAAGPSFQVPSAVESTLGTTASEGAIGYTNIASFSIVKLESEIGTALENVEEAEVHARCVAVSSGHGAIELMFA